MSHLVSAPLKILDLDALRSAAASFGATMEKASTFTSYTGDGNPCEHRIKLHGVRYEVGVIRDAKTGAYSLSHDPYGNDYSVPKHDGHKLEAKFGKNLGLLTQRYAVQTVVIKAKAKGWMIQHKTLPNGSVQLRMIQA